jgi:hypothetical protein
MCSLPHLRTGALSKPDLAANLVCPLPTEKRHSNNNAKLPGFHIRTNEHRRSTVMIDVIKPDTIFKNFL